MMWGSVWRRGLLWPLLAGLFLTTMLFGQLAPAAQANGPIQVIASTALSQFPQGIRFAIEVESQSPVQSIVVRYQVQGERVRRYDYVPITPGPRVSGDLLVRTDTGDRYIPPGAEVEYFFEVETAAGDRLSTEPKQLTLLDSRFSWRTVQAPLVTAFYYGDQEARATIVAVAASETLQRLSVPLKVTLGRPVRVLVYNSVQDMLGALPPTSPTIRTSLITEGVMFGDNGVILVLLTSDPRGVVCHETTHYLVALATADMVFPFPAWLNEGLAEWGNCSPSPTYDFALSNALGQGELLPITDLTTPPGRPNDVILFYGEGKSLVQFMASSYGEERFGELLALLGQNVAIDAALKQVYGLDRLELENAWRRALGAPDRQPPVAVGGLPTPVPWPTIVPYGVATPTPAAAQPTPTSPIPSPTPTVAVQSGCGRAPPGAPADLALLAIGGGVLVVALVRRRPR